MASLPVTSLQGDDGTAAYDWENVSVKEEPEEEHTGPPSLVTEIVKGEEIKEENSDAEGGDMAAGGGKSTGELHYVSRSSVMEPAARDELLAFTPFRMKEELEDGEVPLDLSYLDDARLCMSPRDHEIDPEQKVTTVSDKSPHSPAAVTLKRQRFNKPGPLHTKILASSQYRIIGKVVAKGNSSVCDVKHCVVELCKRSSCGVDCKCLGKVAPGQGKVTADPPPKPAAALRKAMDGKRQMKMSVKLRAFYEARHRNRLAQMKKSQTETAPASVDIKIMETVTLKKSSATSAEGKPKRVRRSRRLVAGLYCPVCSKEFHYRFSLRRHIKAHSLRGEKLPPTLEREEPLPGPGIVSVYCYQPNSEYSQLIEAGQQSDESPPHLEPEVPLSYTHLRALLTNPSPEPVPATPPKPARVVLNVPKIDLSRRHKAQAREGVPGREAWGEAEDAGLEEDNTEQSPQVPTVITIEPIEELSEEAEDDGEGQSESLTGLIHPSCNPVVIIAPINELHLPTTETGQDSESTEPSALPAQPEVSTERALLSSVNKASGEIFSILSQAGTSADVSPPTLPDLLIREKVVVVTPKSIDTSQEEMEDVKDMEEEMSDPLNDSGVTEEDMDDDGEKEEDGHETEGYEDDELNVAEEKEEIPVSRTERRVRKRRSAAALALANRSKMKSSKMQNKKKASLHKQLMKNMKAIVTAKSKKLPAADSGHKPSCERRERKRKVSISRASRSKTPSAREPKLARIDSDSGIDTESDGSDRAKTSPVAKGKHHQPEPSKSVTIHLMSGEPIAVEDLHARIDNQIAKRTQSVPIVCPICEKKFSYPSEIKRHIMMHTNEREFQCKLCDKAFARRPHLNEHMRVHTGERPFKCKSCPTAFAQKSNLMIHMRTHTGARPFACTECGKRFRRQDAQTQHLLTHHSNVKPYTCAECGAAFPCLRYLKDHMKCHSKERPFKCSQCSAAFVCNKYLKLHIRALHTNVRPYKCDMCPAKFTQSGKLVEHQRIHTGERPYTCSSCGADFVRSGHLRRHLLTHTGERPYSCSECPAKFSQKDHLKRHMKGMHPTT